MSSMNDLEKAIIDARCRFSATSCTFYMKDPWWPDDLRLLFMPGVKVPEPMHGFLTPRVSKLRITEGSNIELIQVVQTDWRTKDEALAPTLSRLIQEKPVFGNFAVREGVQSCVRLIFRDDNGGTQGSLFLNYDDALTEESFKLQRPQFDSLFEAIAPMLTSVGEELRRQDPLPIMRLLRILDTTLKLTGIGDADPPSDRMVNEFYTALLQSILEAYGLTNGDGFGTIYLFDRHNEILELAARFPRDTPAPERLLCKRGEGTITWVALKGRPVLINSIEESEFRKQRVYLEVKKGIKNALALPMLVADKVVGVLNIESLRADSFGPEAVRVLWYAANHAAVASYLGQRVKEYNALANRTRSLLEICKNTVANRTVNTTDSTDKRLDRLANLLADWINADMCDIWGYDRKSDEFWGAGASSREIELQVEPRKLGEGCSRHVITRRSIVWINEIKSEKSFVARVWSPDEEEWLPVVEFPETVSPVLASLRVGAEIGVPIESSKGVLGVAWLKFRHSLQASPSVDLINQLSGLVASIALVMEFMREYDESVQESEEDFKMRLVAYRKKLFPHEFPAIDGLIGYIRGDPVGGAIGGDFFSYYKWQNQKRVAIILGDGENHGIEGALEMLPLYTAFRILCSQTTSTHYVLEKMGEVARDIGVAGSAIYFIIDLPDDDSGPWTVSASVAGDAPPLMIFDLKGNQRQFPPLGSDNLTRLGVELPPPLGEALTTCSANDIIVAVTDGILDAGARDENVRTFGSLGVVSSVSNVLHKNRDARPKDIADAIFEKARQHGTIHDDATILVIRMAQKTSGLAGPNRKLEFKRPSLAEN